MAKTTMVSINKSRFRIASTTLVVLIVLFSIYAVWGYTTVQFPDKTIGAVYVNGQFVGDTPTNLKLRVGTYDIRYSNAEQADVNVHVTAIPFTSKVIKGQGGAPEILHDARIAVGAGTGGFTYDFQQFGTVWAAGVVTIPDSAQYLVMKYEHGQWDTVYLGTGTDQDFHIVLPYDIQVYLNSINDPAIGLQNGN